VNVAQPVDLRLQIGMLSASGLFLLCGGVVGFWGHQEFRLGQLAQAEPARVELTDIKRGQPLENHHVVIGPHYALYVATVYSYRTTETNKPFDPRSRDPKRPIDYCFYAIVPLTDEAAKKRAEPGDDQTPYQLPRNIRVIVKTRRYKTLGEIPKQDVRREESVQGTMVNEIRPLGEEERQLLKDGLEGVKLDEVWVLEEGREPSASAKSVGMLVCGGLMFLGAALAGIWATVQLLLIPFRGVR
jgi:hypothetical protein